MSYEIIKYDEKYNEQIYEIEKEIWNPDPYVNKAYLQWKYFENPYSGSPNIYLVLSDGELIGFRGMYPTEWMLGDSGETFTALCAADLIIKPSLRNRGIYQTLMNFVIEDLNGMGYLCLLNFSASPVNVIGSLASGWKSTGIIRVMKKQYHNKAPSPITVIKKLLRKTGINKLVGNKKKLKRKTTLEIHENITKSLPPQIKVDTKPKPAEMALLVSRLIPEKQITLLRNERYYSWRYKNPLSKFLFLYWYDEELKGYLVAQTHFYGKTSFGSFNIVELESISSEIRTGLLKAFAATQESGSIKIWSSMLDAPSCKFLESIGFKEQDINKSVTDYSPAVLVYPFYENRNNKEFRGPDLLDINSWDLKMIYSDSY